jgi:tRNA-splicing ligase RtcB
MKWIKDDKSLKIPIKSWCEEIEPGALEQAENLANHPVTQNHVALMPDAHVGYGMPIGGVIAAENAILPNAVGVDIGCGMGAIKTDFLVNDIGGKTTIREILNNVKDKVPVGEGNSHKSPQKWDGFPSYLKTLGIGEEVDDYNNPKLPAWFDKATWNLAFKNLGTLGGGNHIRDMNFAMEYAKENRRLLMEAFKQAIINSLGNVRFIEETNIHHNYAALENHFEKMVWVHRKGATSAKSGEKGIIPGSMGTSSYIVEGLGNAESFQSCSHGAGRKMGRMEACRSLTTEECDEAMEGIVFDRWSKLKKFGKINKAKNLFDLGESPLAYKNIDEVIQSELDLIKPVVKLKPLGVVKG